MSNWSRPSCVSSIASVMELVNDAFRFVESAGGKWTSSQKALLRELSETLILMIGPFVPHLAEELWEKLGHPPSLFSVPWPAYDPQVLQMEKVSLVVQVNGKVRSKVEVETNASEAAVKKRVLEDAVLRKWIDGKVVKQWIIVPKKLVNLVV